MGYIVPIEYNEVNTRTDRKWYLPHHPVVNPNKPHHPVVNPNKRGKLK